MGDTSVRERRNTNSRDRGLEKTIKLINRTPHKNDSEIKKNLISGAHSYFALKRQLRDAGIYDPKIEQELDGVYNHLIGLVNAYEIELEQRKRESYLDALTGIGSRKNFDETLENRIGDVDIYGGELSVIIFDLNHFKPINDTYGHQAGDEILKGVANSIKLILPDYDASRIGGDEFGVIAMGADEQKAHDDSETLRKFIESRRFIYENEKLSVTIAAGVKQHEYGESARELTKSADAAFYAAHKTGKNKTVKYSTYLAKYTEIKSDS
jgi:diguanylate cyclase (GGDEF)-like protein